MSREILDQHRILWEKKKVTRYLYNRWYGRIEGELAPLGLTVELGAGTGNFKEFMPSSLSSDLVYCEWLDVVHDAMALPYGDGAVGNFVLIDSIHHVKKPAAVL
ncbi:MAG: SAM-dependent methyltransferase, partial [Deltaproteobacteria bacterium]|nr:SAM-dependent methyltransferase [Deltaproteobacteria bacterium]